MLNVEMKPNSFTFVGAERNLDQSDLRFAWITPADFKLQMIEPYTKFKKPRH